MANMPVHKLIGGFRDRIRAYQVVTSLSYEENLKAAAKAKDDGFFGFKDHMMLGVETNLSLARDLRDLVGDEFELMHDPVQQYTVDEAIYVGKALQDLGYLWIEEPLQEVDIRGLKKLADALELPVLALESIEGHPYLVVPYLVAGAVDIVRQRGLGITGQIKLANLCDMFGVGCHGGNPHVVAAMRNDDWWEHSSAPLAPPPSLQTAFATSSRTRPGSRADTCTRQPARAWAGASIGTGSRRGQWPPFDCSPRLDGAIKILPDHEPALTSP